MSENRKPPVFKNRWLITGTLTTESPLHIGDGFSAELHHRECPADKTLVEPEHDAQTVCVDFKKEPYFPASSLRGVLRSCVDLQDSPVALSLFGHPDPETPGASGGKLIVYDAFIQGEPLSVAHDPQHLPFWSKKRRTCVAANVSIDRRTRTAVDKLLFHTEYVPAGTSFKVELGGDGLDEKEVSLLLSLLNRFNSGLRLGADVASGWGKVKWALGHVYCLDDLSRWESNTSLPALSPAEVEKLMPSEPSQPALDQLVFDLTLHFPGPLLIRDPKQALRSAKAKRDAKPHGRSARKEPNAKPWLAEDQQPFIPGQTVRGVLRSRLECILRTIGHSISAPDQLTVVTYPELVPQLDMVSMVFGAPGWKAPLECSRFTLAKGCKPTELVQEFVAIDRFTGSVDGSKKFDATAVVGASVTGKLTLDLSRIPETLRPEAKQRLALLLRDLMEGDLRFGSGASKGYGHCTSASGKVSDTTESDLFSWISQQFPSTPA